MLEDDYTRGAGNREPAEAMNEYKTKRGYGGVSGANCEMPYWNQPLVLGNCGANRTPPTPQNYGPGPFPGLNLSYGNTDHDGLVMARDNQPRFR